MKNGQITYRKLINKLQKELIKLLELLEQMLGLFFKADS